MSWDDASNRAKEDKKRGGLFVRIESGGHLDGVFRGEPYLFYRSEDFEDKTEFSEYAEGLKSKFRANFLILDEGTFRAKIMEGGPMLRDEILDKRELFGEGWMDKLYRYRKTGSGLKTEHKIDQIRDLTPDEIKAADGMDLHNIGPRDGEEKDDIPF